MCVVVPVLYHLVKVVGFTNLIYPDSPILSLLIMIATITTRTIPLTILVHQSARSWTTLLSLPLMACEFLSSLWGLGFQLCSLRLLAAIWPVMKGLSRRPISSTSLFVTSGNQQRTFGSSFSLQSDAWSVLREAFKAALPLMSLLLRM